MSNPQYSSTGGLGWSFYPSSDRYSLVPKWSEWHGISGRVFDAEDEHHRFTVVASVDDPVVSLTVDLKEWDDVLDVYVVPTGTPVFSAKASVPFGFAESYDLTTLLVLVDGVWDGGVSVVFPPEVRTAIGVEVPFDFHVDYWTVEDPSDRSRIAYGTAVLRK